MNDNDNKKIIHYATNEIANFYSHSRICWNDIYQSEKWIIHKVAGERLNLDRVLDVGCATGGLGVALNENFVLSEYIGVDVNCPSISVAKQRKISVKSEFICGDILDVNSLQLESFNTVFSLSCADWNNGTEPIIQKCWEYVKENGHFIMTLRLTPKLSISNIEESFQYIYYQDDNPKKISELEKAPYVIFNVKDAIQLLTNLSPRPSKLTAYGYWGKPSLTSNTPYDRLVFTALSLEKRKNVSSVTDIECHWPANLLL